MKTRPERVQAEVQRACRDATDVIELHRSVAEVLQPVVPFDRWCGLVLDPATLFTTCGYHAEGLPAELFPRLIEIEAADDDVNGMTALARTKAGVSTIDRATGGRPETSERYRDVLGPGGLGRELRAVLRERSYGWGGLVLFRETGAADFSDAEVTLVSQVADVLARGIRRCLLTSELAHRDDHSVPGMLVIGAGGFDVEVRSSAAAHWLELIADSDLSDGVPMVVGTLVARARSGVDGLARTRVRGRNGVWLTMYAEALSAGPDAQVSVVVEPSRPYELAALMADAYLLTPREREVAQQVLLGRTTQEIAATMFVSAWTVQDHLKNVFDKVGVRSRAELTARLFFGHYEPRLRAQNPLGGDGWFIDR